MIGHNGTIPFGSSMLSQDAPTGPGPREHRGASAGKGARLASEKRNMREHARRWLWPGLNGAASTTGPGPAPFKTGARRGRRSDWRPRRAPIRAWPSPGFKLPCSASVRPGPCSRSRGRHWAPQTRELAPCPGIRALSVLWLCHNHRPRQSCA